MKIKINQPFALNEVGGRDNNEDSVFPPKGKATDANRFFLVCDGIGGHQGGEIASQSVCKSFSELLRENNETFDEDIFDRALSFAYEQLDEKDTDGGTGDKKMGTTLTFLYLHNKGAFMAHIGDSRIYQLRKEEAGTAKVLYKSQDHSLVNDLLRAGVINEEEAETHPKKNIITRAIQPHQEKRSQAEIYRTEDIEAGDYFFMCTDGILEQVNDKMLCDIIASDKTDEEKIRAVYDACRENSKDNFSAYLIPVESVSGEVLLAKEEDFVHKTQIIMSEKEEPISMSNSLPSAVDTSAITNPPKKKKTNRGFLFFLLIIIILGGALWYMQYGKEDSKDNTKTKTETSVDNKQ